MDLKPVVPFEPTVTDIFPEGSQWVGQVKWDGVRELTYCDSHEVRIFNRKLNERTFHYPELTHISEFCSARSVILDGEIISLKDGKPSFYEVMKRDGITKLQNVDALQHVIPITYMVFDILYLNGKWVTSCPLMERQQMLKDIITPNDYVQLVENFDNPKALFQAIKEHEMEGVIIKDLSSTYLVNGKDSRWRKKKFYRDIIAVVGGVTIKDSVVNSLLLGVYDHDGNFRYIGHAGTGKLTRKDWQDLTAGFKPLIQSNMPFVNKPPRVKGTIWVNPVITVKVQFAEWIEGHTLRQPSIQAIVNAPADGCLLE